jgi:hypothetical protein
VAIIYITSGKLNILLHYNRTILASYNPLRSIGRLVLFEEEMLPKNGLAKVEIGCPSAFDTDVQGKLGLLS